MKRVATLVVAEEFESRTVLGDAWNETVVELLATHALVRSAQSLPALFREWFSTGLNRAAKEAVTRFVERTACPALLEADVRELGEAVAKHPAWNAKGGEFSVTGSAALRSVQVVSTKDDARLEVAIRFPSNYPLALAEVDVTRQIGIRPDKWRRWALQMVQLLSKRDGSLIDAVTLWKDAIDKELEGVEPCPVCYSCVDTERTLPTHTCSTCKNVFHARCLGKWFASSHQSLCPMCKTSFLRGASSAGGGKPAVS